MSHRFCAFLFSPPFLFAAAFVGYIGHNGGLGLAVSLAFFALIVASLLLAQREAQLQPGTALAYFTHKATPQALVGLLAFSAIPIALAGHDTVSAVFLASAFLYTLGNFCVSYQFYRDFRPLTITALTFFFVPQIWTVAGHLAAMLYNGGPTILALPLVLAMAWLGVTPRIGKWVFPRSVPSYMGAVYNVWYIICNVAGDAPNIYMIASCSACVVASCMLAQKARAGELLAFAEEKQAQEAAIAHAQAQTPPVDGILVEVPNLTFQLPHLSRDHWLDGLYTPSPVYFAGR